MDRLLEGQAALVTGASSGIGRASALALGAAGAKVAVNYRSQRYEAEKAVAEIEQGGGEAFAVQGDVSSEAEVEEMFARAIERFGTIDILVNNAGIQADARFVEMSLDDWRKVLDVNLTGAFLCSRAAVREFLRRGVREEVSKAAGKIVNMSSVHQQIPWSGRANYAVSKAGLWMLTRTLAQEFAADRIRVNAIAPGAIKTPINETSWSTDGGRKELLELIPSGRIGAPEDVARAVTWLASDESDYVTGETLFIDGGMTLYPAFRRGQEMNQ